MAELASSFGSGDVLRQEVRAGLRAAGSCLLLFRLLAKVWMGDTDFSCSQQFPHPVWPPHHPQACSLGTVEAQVWKKDAVDSMGFI